MFTARLGPVNRDETQKLLILLQESYSHINVLIDLCAEFLFDKNDESIYLSLLPNDEAFL